MILLAKAYLAEVLNTIGITSIFGNLAEVQNDVSPLLWAVVEHPDPEAYTPSYKRELFADAQGVRTYHIKDYDVEVVLLVRIGAGTDELANGYKRNFLRALSRYIQDSDGYRIAITPLSGSLNPADFALGESSHVLLRIGFTGGLWRREQVNLIKEIVPEGQITRTAIEMEVK